MPLTPRLRKPLWVVTRYEQQQQQQHEAVVERHLTLFDLVSVGVGGTVGSGIFVLAGFVAHNYAGPATTLSFAISGLAACCSGICFAELAGRLPASGSTYTYAYVAMGELTAVVVAACLSLEYAVSGAAVARSWGSKFVVWLTHQWNVSPHLVHTYLLPGYGLNPMAFVISVLSTAVLVKGIPESKLATNFFTVLKVGLVIFMTVGALFFFQPRNLTPFAPKGAGGVMHGATSCFFAYLGYDEVCVISGEALHPQRDMPWSVLLTLLIITVLYILAVFSLSGMQPYTELNPTSAFSVGFQQHNAPWMAQITAAGEIITLPVVVLVSLLAQPRLFQAMAMDGLLPPIFSKVDSTGNLRMGALISGVGMTVLATFVPFRYLNDLISAGILVAFSITNSCLVLLRCKAPPNRPGLLRTSLLVYNTLCFLTGLVLTRANSTMLSLWTLALTLASLLYMNWQCPKSETFGGSVLQMDSNESGATTTAFFEVPLVPWIPCVGMFVNWCLIAQLSWGGLWMLVGYIAITVALYVGFCGNEYESQSNGWRRRQQQQQLYEPIEEVSDLVAVKY